MDTPTIINRTQYIPFDLCRSGWRAFLRIGLSLEIPHSAWDEIGYSLPRKEKLTVKDVMESDQLFLSNLSEVVDEFCFAYHNALARAGYCVAWKVIKAQILEDGTSADGPGIVVFLRRPVETNGRRMDEVDVSEKGAIAIGNALNFLHKGVLVRVNALEYGIRSGGANYDALIAKPHEHSKDVEVEQEIVELRREVLRERRMLEAYDQEARALFASPAFLALNGPAQRQMINDLRDRFGLAHDSD